MHAAVLLLLFSTIMSSIYEKVMNDLHLGAKFFPSSRSLRRGRIPLFG